MIEAFKRRVQQNSDSSNIDFLFARHGESDGNALGDTCPIMHDTPLTERGRAEALKISEYLKSTQKSYSHILCSKRTLT